jgi:hypothetical protein
VTDVIGVRDSDQRGDRARTVLATSVAAYADALAEVIGGLFVAAGVDPEVGACALERAATRVRQGDASLDISDNEPWLQLCDALAVWWRDPAYIGDNGRPHKLPDSGPAPSLDALLTRTVDRALHARARELLRQKAAVERNGVWECSLDRNAMPLGGMEGVHRLRMTLAGNARTYVDSQVRPDDLPQHKNFDMTAHNVAFPMSDVPELRAKLYKRLQGVLEDTDFWMTKTADQSTTGPVVQVGVTAFMYMSSPRPRAAEGTSLASGDTDDSMSAPSGAAPSSR